MYTTHGHHIPFTHLTEGKPDAIPGCGGPRMCGACTVEAMPYMPAFDQLRTAILAGLEPKEQDLDIQEKAKKLVFEYATEHLDKTDDVAFTVTDVYVVWFSKTLQNWKALLSTTLPDGMYYEVTYNGNKGEAYIDAYKKFDNVRVPDPERVTSS